MNGIGGRTIAEAQERLSISEFNIWLKYREKYGQLNLMMRCEWGAALISSVLANVNRTKNSPPFKITDFAPHINEPEITLEEAMNKWG
ncbi:phage tail assembly protein T [Raoultella ornithinolytica]|uniref:phage tail assembly protein T n=1 Tax=Klebsiella/Raoultella group TaxID=2890311 RepID=UPI0019583A54|nr:MULTISPECIES: phage tail protein [Klebsiella/Raoultella group]ELS5400299.1 phage tail protein [Raoultella ornithinolytica]ELS5454784.1 phage tail protein [Raoultella ornithinolytica]ELS5479020.1 phage tail protein [Raoultella ornithinolytica]MDV1388094.1 phage tail protein [Raoultella ornithinolytica]QRU52051.1 phage tail protein [Klebsiella oxytoca]